MHATGMWVTRCPAYIKSHCTLYERIWLAVLQFKAPFGPPQGEQAGLNNDAPSSQSQARACRHWSMFSLKDSGVAGLVGLGSTSYSVHASEGESFAIVTGRDVRRLRDSTRICSLICREGTFVTPSLVGRHPASNHSPDRGAVLVAHPASERCSPMEHARMQRKRPTA